MPSNVTTNARLVLGKGKVDASVLSNVSSTVPSTVPSTFSSTVLSTVPSTVPSCLQSQDKSFDIEEEEVDCGMTNEGNFLLIATVGWSGILFLSFILENTPSWIFENTPSWIFEYDSFKYVNLIYLFPSSSS